MVSGIPFYAEIVAIFTEIAPFLALAGGVGVFELVEFLVGFGGVDLRNPHVFFTDLAKGNVIASETVGHPIVDAFVKAPLGLLGVEGGPGTQEAWNMLARMMGFGIVTPFAVSGIESVMKLMLADRAPEGALEHLARIPEELGTPFALGEIIHDFFMQAIGPALEEAINERWMPRRIDIQTARLLLRQHKIGKGQWEELSRKLGFDPTTRTYWEMLTSQPLVTSELQALFQYGVIGEQEVRDKLDILGYEGRDQDLIVALYLKKAETQGGDYYRNVARTAFLDNVITEGQFRAILAQVNVPPQSIDFEVAGVLLENQVKRKSLSVGELKAAFQAGTESQGAVLQALISDGYSSQDATTLIDTWSKEKAPKLKHVSEDRVIKYLLAEVITPAQAYAMLTADGMAPDDARFIVEHPNDTIHVPKEPFSKQLVADAFKDDVITTDQAAILLRQLGDNDEDAHLRLSIALFEKQRRAPKPKKPPKLTIQDIDLAYEAGIVSNRYLQQWMADAGYDATEVNIWSAYQQFKRFGNLPSNWIAL